ncbi:MAG: DUF711 family protein [Desulfurococcales archaeon]|nr:DUF711 family protein [Desulfurococcales archaeon]
MKIRALTLYTLPEKDATKNYDYWAEEKIGFLLDAAKKVETETGIEVWSKRISTNLSPDTIKEVAPVFSKNQEVKAMIYQEALSKLQLNILSEIVRNGMYASIIAGREENLMKAAILIEKISMDNYSYATRFAIEMSGKKFETAYFPLAVHREAGPDRLAIALLYPNDVLESRGSLTEALSHVLEKAYANLKPFIKNGIGGVKVTGIDYSISPWMEESVAGLLQDKGKCQLERLGCLDEVRKVNYTISKFAKEKSGIGFNKVMLPLAEDSELIRLAKEGKIELRDFLLYSTVCVAGIDMIALDISIKDLFSLLKSAYAIARTKQRPYGVRLIKAKKGEKTIRLEGFSEIPVLSFT